MKTKPLIIIQVEVAVKLKRVLCHAMASFELILQTQISSGDSLLSIIILWGSCSRHYFFVP